jgi:hypothetical protein
LLCAFEFLANAHLALIPEGLAISKNGLPCACEFYTRAQLQAESRTLI